MPSRPLRMSLVALSCLLAAAAWGKTQYAVTDLGTLGGTQSQANGMNVTGVIVGASTNAAGVSRAFEREGTTLKDLGGLSKKTASVATDVNRKGYASGYATAADGTLHAVMFAKGKVTDLHAMRTDFVQSQATAINSRNWVAGTALMDDGAYHGWVYARNGFKILDPNTHLYGLNDSGDGVGVDKKIGVVIALGNEEPVGTLGGTYSEADAINAGGVATGLAATKNDKEAHAFTWVGGRMTDLGTLGGTMSQGLAITAKNTVVGWSYTDGAQDSHAFIAKSGAAMQDLNDLLDSSGQGWELTTATGIDPAGLISGTGVLNGATHAFVLTPL